MSERRQPLRNNSPDLGQLTLAAQLECLSSIMRGSAGVRFKGMAALPSIEIPAPLSVRRSLAGVRFKGMAALPGIEITDRLGGQWEEKVRAHAGGVRHVAAGRLYADLVGDGGEDHRGVLAHLVCRAHLTLGIRD